MLDRTSQIEQPSTKDAILNAGCELISLQNSFQDNGQTHFVVMVAPDKLTAYAPYLTSPEYKNLSRLNELYAIPGLNIIDMINPIRRSLQNGIKDLYAPNDTHWSSLGHRLASDTLIKYLSENGILVIPPHNKQHR